MKDFFDRFLITYLVALVIIPPVLIIGFIPYVFFGNYASI